jgi:hypothetical protein
MPYESRAYDNEHGEPIVVLVVTGEHDVSRLVQLFSGRMKGHLATCECIGVADTMLRQVKRHSGGRAALALLKAHGGPDFLAKAEHGAAHKVTVTELPPGFDFSDQRQHEYVIETDGRIVSHQVEHPPACHGLDYGEVCWFDEYWENSPFSYDGEKPGVYVCTPAQHMVGSWDGEDLDDVLDYIHYERTGDVEPESRPAKPSADQWTVDSGAPF